MNEADALRDQLADAGDAYEAAERARDEALERIATLARAAHGTVPIAQIADLTGISRPTVYKMLRA